MPMRLICVSTSSPVNGLPGRREAVAIQPDVRLAVTEIVATTRTSLTNGQ